MAQVQKLDASLTNVEQIQSLTAMDAPDNMDVLHQLGVLAAARDLREDDFPISFDLPVTNTGVRTS